MNNSSASPIFDMLNGCKKLGIYSRIRNIIEGTCIPSKSMWKAYIWERAWAYEDELPGLLCGGGLAIGGPI